MGRLDFAFRTGFEKLFQSFVPESLNHEESVVRNVTVYKVLFLSMNCWDRFPSLRQEIKIVECVSLKSTDAEKIVR